MNTRKKIAQFAKEADTQFPNNTDKAVRVFLKTMNELDDKLRQDMIRLLVIEGVKRELDGVRSSTKHAPLTPSFEPVTPSTPPHVSPSNDTRSSSVRAIINNSLKDVVYGRGENRMALGDAATGDAASSRLSGSSSSAP